MPESFLKTIRTILISVLIFTATAIVNAQDRGPVVLAAASLQESMTEASNAWAAKGHAKPVLSFAASSALARQIESNAPADLFVSADEEWMDDVERKGLLKPNTRISFLSNRLVLVAPTTNALYFSINRGFPLGKALGNGRLSLADPDAVPAGKYAKAALQQLGVWSSVENRSARGENVRAALALVERGEAPLGIAYATDAVASKKVRVAGTFPQSSHPPITYPVAILKSSTHKEAEAFRQFLLSREGRCIFTKYGFGTR